MTITTLDTAIALISLADLKSALGITGTGENTKLTMFINAASQLIEDYLGRGYLIDSGSNRTEVFDGEGSNKLVVNHPIVSVTSVTVTYIPTSSTATYSSSNLTIENDIGVLQIPPKLGSHADPLERGVFPKGFQNVSVVYRYGWAAASIPYDVQLACVDIVGAMRNQLSKSGIKSEKAGNYSVTYENSRDTGLLVVTPGARKLLAGYRTLGFDSTDSIFIY